jgi:LuxR family quorum sensing-dependent transcriptional regulator
MPDTDLHIAILRCAIGLEELNTPAAVLDHLHKTLFQELQLSVLAAARFPLKWGDWKTVEKGKSVFIHRSAPRGWWDEYAVMARRDPDPGLIMARMSLAPFTWTESRQMLEPLGVDRWSNELALKHGMRDGFTCPVGSRWVVAFWSRRVLTGVLTEQMRAMIFMAASFAVIRLEQVTDLDPHRVGAVPQLTPRELSALRLLSIGKRSAEIAAHLGLGEETVRSHLKKAQRKLGVTDRTHAVADALRERLIP